MTMMMVDMEEEDGYVYKGRAVAVEVVVHERFLSLIDAILITLMISTSYLIMIMMPLRLERDVDDHWYDLSKALASFAKNDLQEV